MKVFIYERVSSEEQAKHGYSLDAQHEALVDFCKKHDHVILGEYRDEGISARKPYTKRPAMLQLLNDVEKANPDMILFTKLDRWFRNIKEYYKVQDILDRNRVDWKAINEEYDTSTASGRLYVNIKLSIAQDEADRTSERIKDVQGQLVAQGKVLGGRPPFGYKIENQRLVFGDDIHIVKEAIEHYMLHQSTKTTCRYLNEKYGLTFRHTRLREMFKATTLKGEYRGNPNYCEPLLTPQEWDDLQAIVRKNIKYHPNHRTYLFSGLIKCPACGKNMSGCCFGWGKYYRCKDFGLNICDYNHMVNEAKLEQWLLDNIEEDFKVNVTMKPKQKTEDPKKYRDRLKRLNEMYLYGNISQEEYKTKSADIQKKIAELSKTPALKTQNFTSNWKDVYLKLDDEHRRLFWRGLVKQIVVNQQAQGFEILY